jgi:ABC-type Fe3+/spermidine/putrescine transport system ATPase subunit
MVTAEPVQMPRASADTAAAPPAVEITGVRHSYGSGAPALHRVDLRVDRGSFCTLLGPSGSGKTTLLRILAGLLTPTEGHVHIHGRDVTNVVVQKRDIGFVFQNYALFPHLTVAENVAFPLKIRRRDRATRARRVAEVLELVALSDLGDRLPGELSGGQQQRVAVARALVFEPTLLLLDEPLGALDRSLRQQLGAELRAVQRETGTTAIYVTHDQEEAFLLSDKVVVMNEGRVQQEGAPLDVYTRPSDLFVATFLGDTNVLEGPVVGRSHDSTTIEVDGVPVRCAGTLPDGAGGRFAAFSVRPEDVAIATAQTPEELPDGFCWVGPGAVENSIFMGSRFRVSVRAAQDRLLVAELPRDGGIPEVGSTVSVGWKPGAPVVIERPSNEES